MSRLPRALFIGVLLVVALAVQAAPALAQIPGHVRVVTDSARILRWLRPADEVLVKVNQGTTLEVLDQESDWYWVVLPPSAHGTRKVGWIRAFNVEPFTPPPATPKTDPRYGPETVPPSVPSAKSAPAPAAKEKDEDKVTITAERNTAASSSNSIAATKRYTFDDVHFERDRAAIRPEDMETLRAAVEALKGDSSLVVDIQGYTCNLGTPTHNLTLGAQRAKAVLDYLVSEGIPADRLTTISLGETHAKHDNSQETSRRLNRRVAIVPKGQR
jgi:outer membrane protein OmpA-like peptidoglycan-associated protein